MTEGPVRVRPDDLSWRSIDGEVVLLDERDMQYLHLNGSGADLWESAVAGATPLEMATALVAKFSIPEATAVADVTAFLADLRARDLLQT